MDLSLIEGLIEADDPRRDRVSTLDDRQQYTPLIDGLSLREVPLIREALDRYGLTAEVSFALAPLSTETTTSRAVISTSSAPAPSPTMRCGVTPRLSVATTRPGGCW